MSKGEIAKIRRLRKGEVPRNPAESTSAPVETYGAMHLYLHGMDLFPNFTLKPEWNRENLCLERELAWKPSNYGVLSGIGMMSV